MAWSEGSPQGRGGGACFFGYFLVTRQESISPAGASPGKFEHAILSKEQAPKNSALMKPLRYKAVEPKTLSSP
jgi:hypothetical protein